MHPLHCTFSRVFPVWYHLLGVDWLLSKIASLCIPSSLCDTVNHSKAAGLTPVAVTQPSRRRWWTLWTSGPCSVLFTKKKLAFLDHDSTVKIAACVKLSHLILLPEIAALQRLGWRLNLLVLFNDIPQTKAEKEACLLKGVTKNEDISQEVPEGFVSLSLPSPSRDWEGDFGGKQWRCQQLVPLSAGGQVEKEASLNVREWIREADYASKVELKQKKICSGERELLRVYTQFKKATVAVWV